MLSKQRVRLTLAVIMCSVGLLVSGCSSTRCADCIPRSKMPYTMHYNGIKYHLTDHLSVEQMLQAEFLKYSSQENWIKVMTNNFAKDGELLTYLDGVAKRTERSHMDRIQLLQSVERELEQSGGELYDYKILGKKGDMGGGQIGVAVEEGWIIISKGVVFKTYILAYGGLTDEKWLKLQGLKADP